MVAKNDITKARIVSKPAKVTDTEWDRIFGKRKQELEKTNGKSENSNGAEGYSNDSQDRQEV